MRFLYLLVFLLASCNYSKNNLFESYIKSNQPKNDTLYSVSLSNLKVFKWEELYIIEGPVLANEISEITTVEYYYNQIRDNHIGYIYIRKNSVVNEQSSFAKEFKFSSHLKNNSNYCKFKFSDTLKVAKKNRLGNYYYHILDKE